MTAKPDNPPAFKDYSEAFRHALTKGAGLFAAMKYAQKKFPRKEPPFWSNEARRLAARRQT